MRKSAPSSFAANSRVELPTRPSSPSSVSDLKVPRKHLTRPTPLQDALRKGCPTFIPDNHLSPSEEVKKSSILSRLQSEPFSYLKAVQDERAILIKTLQEYSKSLLHEGKKFTREQKIQDTKFITEVLAEFITHCELQPTTMNAIARTTTATFNLIPAFHACTSPKSLRQAVRMLDQSIDAFSVESEALLFPPTKYQADFGALDHIPFKTFNATLGIKPGSGILFDVDDLLIGSENLQIRAWDVGIDAFGSCDPHLLKHPEIVAQMRELTLRALHSGKTATLLDDLLALYLNGNPKNARYLDQDNPGNARKALEDTLSSYRVEVLVKYAEDGILKFMPGALELISSYYSMGCKIGIVTNSPLAIAEPLLARLFALYKDRTSGLSFDELIPPEHRVYGDTTSQRKPCPLMWLEACRRLGMRPSQVTIFDDNRFNCNDAADIHNLKWAEAIAKHGQGVLLEGDHFNAIVGVTYRCVLCDLEAPIWKSWMIESTKRPNRATLSGFDAIIHQALNFNTTQPASSPSSSSLASRYSLAQESLSLTQSSRQ